MRRQNGFGIVQLLVLFSVIGVISFAGWFVWQNQKTSKVVSQDSNVASSPDLKSIASSAGSVVPSSAPSDTNSNRGYLVIKEWGAKIKLTDASKLIYTYQSAAKPAGGYLSVPTDSDVSLRVAPEFIADDNCAMIDLKWSRSSQQAEMNTTTSTVGNKYFYLWGDGGPNDCSDADKAIRNRVTSEQQANKFEAL